MTAKRTRRVVSWRQTFGNKSMYLVRLECGHETWMETTTVGGPRYVCRCLDCEREPRMKDTSDGRFSAGEDYAGSNAPRTVINAALAYAECADQLGTLLASLQEKHAWQPIATAPKDGTMVLLYPSRCWVDDADRGEVGYWDVDEDEWGGVGSAAEDYTGPTHWMAIPDPPDQIDPSRVDGTQT